MPESVIAAAGKAKGDVEKIPGEDLYIIRVTNGDKACDIINKWITGLTDDVEPNVMAIWAPPASIFGSALDPAAVAINILTEANSIINHYAAFTRQTFQAADPPAIGPPLAPPVVPMQIHHAAMALTKVIGRIQDPADPNYPTIMGLGGGSYVCTIHIQWANVGQTIHVFKN